MRSLFKLFSRAEVCSLLAIGNEAQAERYERFRSYLDHNQRALTALAEMEQMYYSGRPFTLDSACARYSDLAEAVLGAVHDLQALSRGRYDGLEEVFAAIDGAIAQDFDLQHRSTVTDLVLPLARVTLEMKEGTGAKAVNLAALKNELGLPAPDGFVVTAEAFSLFLRENGLFAPLRRILSRIEPRSYSNMGSASFAAQELINQAQVPESLGKAVLEAFDALAERTGGTVRVAVRSSAIGEDTEATFAGQYASVLNVDRDGILDAYRTVLASNYSAKALAYRLQYGLDDRETPMCALVLPMVRAAASGVVYTSGSSVNGAEVLKISAIRGLGEQLVDGSASPDIFLLDKEDLRIAGREVKKKEQQLVSSAAGGVTLAAVPRQEQETPSIDDATAVELGRHARALERFFHHPQDIEWALDDHDRLFILQSRPLIIPKADDEADVPKDFAGHPVLLAGGSAASRGIAAGRVFLVRDASAPESVPENAILVAKTASSDYARVISSLKGIITDVGSAASHLSSVAREFGVPALLDTNRATDVLPDGELITLFADARTVYQGQVAELAGRARPAKRPHVGGPVHGRMRRILDRISPLNLTDPEGPDFSPGGCRTLHDIIRFTHEQAMREMFSITEDAAEVRSVELKATIPLNIRLIDIGGGLQPGLTTCSTVTPDLIESIPLRALWKGLTHPGIVWEGAVGLSAKNILTLLSSSGVPELGDMPGGVSYAMISSDYLNLSAKFGYHFATIDALCGEASAQNHVSIQFAGGAGSYYGKTLRVAFLGNVLKELGFQVTLKGDLLEASLTGLDRAALDGVLDRLGRLLASSRLLDMALSNHDDVERMTASFLQEKYDFLVEEREDSLRNYFAHGGYWKRVAEEGRDYAVQDGSRAGFTLSSGVVGVMQKLVGPALQDFLDNIKAYYYFPLAIARDARMEAGRASVKVKCVGGNIDRAGGLAFGLRNVGNYFVLRVNALEDNIILFEYVNGERFARVDVKHPVRSDTWYRISVEFGAGRVRGYLDDTMVVDYGTEKPLAGYIGLWTKADSVTYFDDLTITSAEKTRTISF